MDLKECVQLLLDLGLNVITAEVSDIGVRSDALHSDCLDSLAVNFRIVSSPSFLIEMKH